MSNPNNNHKNNNEKTISLLRDEDDFEAFFDQSKSSSLKKSHPKTILKNESITTTKTRTSVNLRNKTSLIKKEDETSLQQNSPHPPVKKLSSFYSDSSDEENNNLKSKTSYHNQKSQVAEKRKRDSDSEVSLSPPPIDLSTIRTTANTKRSIITKSSSNTSLPSSSVSGSKVINLDGQADEDCLIVSNSAKLSTLPLSTFASQSSALPSTAPSNPIDRSLQKKIKILLQFHFGPHDKKLPIKAKTIRGADFQSLIQVAASIYKYSSSLIIFCFNGVRLSPYATPISVGMSDKSVIDVYDPMSYNAMIAKSNEQKGKLLSNPIDVNEDEEFAINEEDLENMEDLETNDHRVRLTIKDSSKESVKLKASKVEFYLEKTVADLIKAYIKKKRLNEKIVVVLKFEGEKLDPSTTIEDLDVEDGDMLEAKVVN